MTNKLREIAESAPEQCPHPDCGDSGCYPIMTEHGCEPQQCEFCYTNKNSIFNRQTRLAAALKLACDVIDMQSEALTMYSNERNWISRQTISGRVCEEWSVIDEKYRYGHDRAKEALTAAQKILEEK